LFQGAGADEDADEPAEVVARIAAPAARAFGRDVPADLLDRLARNFCAWQERARGDALRIEGFMQGLPDGVPLVQVPNLPRDIHDLEGLTSLHPFLLGREPRG
ncbi:MAG: hypothetical protein ACKO2K_14350, partial [Alphaproteobacteria bacterium]